MIGGREKRKRTRTALRELHLWRIALRKEKYTKEKTGEFVPATSVAKNVLVRNAQGKGGFPERISFEGV